MEGLQFFLGITLSIFGFFFLYVMAHVAHEQKTGKGSPLFWEKGGTLDQIKEWQKEWLKRQDNQ